MTSIGFSLIYTGLLCWNREKQRLMVNIWYKESDEGLGPCLSLVAQPQTSLKCLLSSIIRLDLKCISVLTVIIPLFLLLNVLTLYALFTKPVRERGPVRSQFWAGDWCRLRGSASHHSWSDTAQKGSSHANRALESRGESIDLRVHLYAM